MPAAFQERLPEKIGGLTTYGGYSVYGVCESS